MTISAKYDGETKVIQSGEIAAIYWTSDEFDGEDLLPACRSYVEFLSRLVEDREHRFEPLREAS